MSEDDHIALVNAGDGFWEGFGKLVARALSNLPPTVDREDAMYYLGDKTSIWGCAHEKYMGQPDDQAEAVATLKEVENLIIGLHDARLGHTLHDARLRRPLRRVQKSIKALAK